MHEVAASVDLARYADIASRLLPRPVGVVLVHQGENVAHAGTLDVSAGDMLASMEIELPLWWQREERLSLTIASGIRIHIFPLRNHLKEIIGQLVVSYAPTSDEDQIAIDALQSVVECLESEIKLNRELSDMAEELSARYEELNLVFETPDEVNEFEDTQKHLAQLVTNCHDYMNVGLCGLAIQGERSCFSARRTGIAEQDESLVMQIVAKKLLPWMQDVPNVIVVNGLQDVPAESGLSDLPYKFVATPIFNGHQAVMGVLVVANLYSQPNFNNSDKNLLGVMARKSAKILQASYDDSTGLVKRSGYEYHLRQAKQAVEANNETYAVLLVNIDRMQVLNETLGFDAGDELISWVASELQQGVRGRDLVSRFDGDEFGILLVDCPLQAALGVARKIGDQIQARTFSWHGKDVEVSVSIGVSPLNTNSGSIAQVLAAVEMACSSAKEQGGGQVCVFERDDNELLERQHNMQLVSRIQEALRTDRFALFAQPIQPLLNVNAPMHAEVLVRMVGEDGEIVPPNLFLPAAERYHLMPAIDRWVIAESLRVICASGIYTSNPGMVVTVNLTGQTLSDPSIVEFVCQCLDKHQIPPGGLCFEITETTAIGDLALAQKFIAALKGREVLFALDDFGTGLSSFAYLKELDVDYLKIDGGFVKEICNDPVADTMVRAINEVAHSMNLITVGEFVVDDDVRARLCEIGVDYGQGFALARPAPLQEILEGLGAGLHRAVG
jgi:diguanylate cyclase (GGDEF)-like protein